MKFTKMHGLGNDYVYVNGFKEKIVNPSEIARMVSDRHFGVGSDGLILINPSDKADFEMEMYNADGSRGEMCGNGIRCVAKYVYDYGLTDQKHISVETLGGIKYLELTVKEGKAEAVRVDMGSPELDALKIPILVSEEWEAEAGENRMQAEEGASAKEEALTEEGVSAKKEALAEEGASAREEALTEEGASAKKEVLAEGRVHTGRCLIHAPIFVDGEQYYITGVSMGNPHVVVYVEDVQGLDIEKIGPKFENHERFPNRINTEFAKVIDRKTVEMRVWERGSGETLACGTGACAVAVASVLNGLTENKVTVKLLGGNLEIEWDREADKVYMTGPAAVVFDGEIDIQNRV